jgi:uncharacterized protein (TIGR03000 family)
MVALALLLASGQAFAQHGHGGHGGVGHAGVSHAGVSHVGVSHVGVSNGFIHSGVGRGFYGYPYARGYGYLSSPFYASYPYSYPSLYYPSYAATYASNYIYNTAPTVIARRSDYYGPESGTGAPDRPTPAWLQIEVPAEAEIWFEGVKTTQTGASRTFESPPLPVGREFVYEVKARWLDKGGKEVVQTRQVPVQAGLAIKVDFNVQAPETIPVPRERRP